MKANGILAYVRTATSDTGMTILGKTTLQMLSVETCTVLTMSRSFLSLPMQIARQNSLWCLLWEEKGPKKF